MCQECWNINEVKDLVERLLEDHQKITIGRIYGGSTHSACEIYVVEWSPDPVLNGSRQKRARSK